MQKHGLFVAILLSASIGLMACGDSKSNSTPGTGGRGGTTARDGAAGTTADGGLDPHGAGADASMAADTDAPPAGRADAGIVDGIAGSGGTAAAGTGGTALTGTGGIPSTTGGLNSGGIASGGMGGTSAGTGGQSSGGGTTGTTTSAKTPDAGVVVDAPVTSDSADADASIVDVSTSSGPDAYSSTDAASFPINACTPAVSRGGKYFNFAEKFNRYYTDCAWKPSKTVYVSPTGTGTGTSRTDAADVFSVLANVQPGEMIVFTAGTYSGCYELDSDHSGTYDNPIVLTGERKADGSIGAIVNCCGSGRKTCFNLEAADYVAVEGFELVGGNYGVRSVGADYAADQHQKGIAILRNVAHSQNGDPFFTGQSDWLALESCTGYDVGSSDGHGIYLSNGGDWNIVRWNETYNTSSSDFQINPDPISTCEDEGIAFDSPECDAVAGTHTTGGRGASDYMLIDSNFFHDSKAQGPNFTSVRNSTIKNNIFALPARHGASFWQETTNPKLGSTNNLVLHNLFITAADGRQALGITNSSTGNQFKNNLMVAISISSTSVTANPDGLLLSTDATTVAANTFEHNAWISGFFDSEDSAAAYTPNATEHRLTTFDAVWFAAFPTTPGRDPGAFAPTASAPWLNKGNLLPDAPTDRAGTARKAPVDLGPYER